jgi:hypothetical protein
MRLGSMPRKSCRGLDQRKTKYASIAQNIPQVVTVNNNVLRADHFLETAELFASLSSPRSRSTKMSGTDPAFGFHASRAFDFTRYAPMRWPPIVAIQALPIG